MGCATAEGTDRAIMAAKGALNSPLLNDNEISGAKKVLVNITTGTMQVTMDEIGDIMEYVQQEAGSTDIILGTCDDPSLGDKLSVTLIATGFDMARKAPAFVEQKVVKVYELNDKPEVIETAAPVVAPVQQDLVPVVEEIKPVVEEEPIAEVKTVTDEVYTLFNITEETKEENVVSFEFEVSREEQAIAPEVLSEQPQVEQPVLDTPVTPQEEFVTYTKTSYETNTTTAIPHEELNQKLEDRKKVLAGLSYRFGSKQNVNELENEPAYKRKGLDFGGDTSYSSQNDMSRYTIGNDGSEKPEIKKNNSFLHDNVD